MHCEDIWIKLCHKQSLSHLTKTFAYKLHMFKLEIVIKVFPVCVLIVLNSIFLIMIGWIFRTVTTLINCFSVVLPSDPKSASIIASTGHKIPDKMYCKNQYLKSSQQAPTNQQAITYSPNDSSPDCITKTCWSSKKNIQRPAYIAQTII